MGLAARGLPHPYKGGKRTAAKHTAGDTRLTPKQRVWSAISHPTPNFEPSTGISGAPESLPCFERTPWQGCGSRAVADWSNKKGPCAGPFHGRYWARTSDPQLVELV